MGRFGPCCRADLHIAVPHTAAGQLSQTVPRGQGAFRALFFWHGAPKRVSDSQVCP